MNDYIIFDIETTGLSQESDAIMELSALKVADGSIADEFSVLVKPGRPIPDLICDITGITNDMVKDAPPIEDVLGCFVDFIGDLPLVGQNIMRFDMKFIQRDAQRILGRTLGNKIIDTLFLAKRLLPELEHHSLEALAEHYDISYEGAHRALVDCNINYQVYLRLLEEMKNPSEAAKLIKYCSRCGNLLKKRSGAYGEFWGCASFPDCRYTRNVK
ncbi:DNA polymerase-3 subunit epsilon [Ruminococcaceae bacterium YRB3002]|nr:DNA polymerase-3 subunit epsilon [Ruminococcaceae bacterium YRB3002]